MEEILKILRAPGKSLLCVGPLSTNIVAVAADLSEQKKIPIVLIASRRQVDAKDLGGGYVNNWNTEEFTKSIRSLGRGQLFLARDHGGPGQGSFEIEKKIAPQQWMEIAKKSYAVDIECGMDFLHLDPSIPLPGETFSAEKTISRLLELYGYTQELAHSKGKKIAFEIGTEDQSGLPPDLAAMKHLLETVKQFCSANRFPFPLFVVAQTGTRVEEMGNVGYFESTRSDNNNQVAIAKLNKEAAELASNYSCFLKEHNADYLSSPLLAMRPHIGIKATNVAPEFGVAETKSLMHLMRIIGCHEELAEFQRIVLDSGRWRKWMRPGSNASDEEKVFIGGHYNFSHPEVIALKQKTARAAAKKDIDLDRYLQQNIHAAMQRYIMALGLN
jgi:hypothetical protein